MNIWIASLLPINLIKILPAVSLIVIGLVVEKHYVGRISIFANAVALATFFVLVPNLPKWMPWYINLISILGIIAFFSYFFKIQLPREFYFMGGMVASVVSGFLLLVYGL